MARYVYPFLSYISPRDYARDLRIFQLRDAAAAMDVVGALDPQGYRFGDFLLNAPSGNPSPSVFSTIARVLSVTASTVISASWFVFITDAIVSVATFISLSVSRSTSESAICAFN